MANRIPQAFIDDLLVRTDIVELIDEHIPLKKAGRDYHALCPFHQEKTPSFTVNQEKQFFYCFGCGASGTAISFLMQHLGMEFPDAITELSNRLGISIPQKLGDVDQDSTTKLYALMDKVVAFYQANLHSGQQQARCAIEYLRQRGINKSVATEYELGYAQQGWDGLTKALGHAGAEPKYLTEIGAISKSEKGHYYDRFRHRLIFPIRDQRGRAIGLGGRVLDDSTPKYLNSPETRLFHKGEALYGLYQAKKAIKELDFVYVVEGYMDVITLAQFGIHNVVATLGTAIRVPHIEKLFRSANRLIFCFDGDTAGENAAHNAMDIALAQLYEGRQVFFRMMDAHEDPDSYIRKHGETLFQKRELLVPLSDRLLTTLQRDLSLAIREDRNKLVHRATPYLQKMPQSNLKQSLIREIAKLGNLDPQVLEARYQASQKRQHSPLLSYASPQAPNPVTMAISYLLREPSLVLSTNIKQELEQIDITGSPFLQELVQFILDHPKVHSAGIIEHWRDTKYGKRLTELMPTNSPYKGEDEALYTKQEMARNLTAIIEKMKALDRKSRLKHLTDIKSIKKLTASHMSLLPPRPPKK